MSESKQQTPRWIPILLGAALVSAVMLALILVLDKRGERSSTAPPADLLERIERLEKWRTSTGEQYLRLDKSATANAKDLASLEKLVGTLRHTVDGLATRPEVPAALTKQLAELQDSLGGLQILAEANKNGLTKLRRDAASPVRDAPSTGARDRAAVATLETEVGKMQRTLAQRASAADLRRVDGEVVRLRSELQSKLKVVNRKFGELPTSAGSGGGDALPSGTILALASGAKKPPGWEYCDGKGGRPDLRGRFCMGATTQNKSGHRGGSLDIEPRTVRVRTLLPKGTYVLGQQPEGIHAVATKLTNSRNFYWIRPAEQSLSWDAGANLPPYYAVTWIVKS